MRFSLGELLSAQRTRTVTIENHPLVTPHEAESILVTGCPTEPANLAPFQKCPFELRYTQQVIPKTVCFVTVHWCQSWGREGRVHGAPQPRHWGACAAYVTLSVQHPRTLRAHELKFHVDTKHEQPLLGFHASRALELLSVVEENIIRSPGGTC